MISILAVVRKMSIIILMRHYFILAGPLDNLVPNLNIALLMVRQVTGMIILVPINIRFYVKFHNIHRTQTRVQAAQAIQ
jgi:hypothetical protein